MDEAQTTTERMSGCSARVASWSGGLMMAADNDRAQSDVDARWRELQDEAERVADEVERQMPGGKWHAETLRAFMTRADVMFREAHRGSA